MNTKKELTVNQLVERLQAFKQPKKGYETTHLKVEADKSYYLTACAIQSLINVSRGALHAIEGNVCDKVDNYDVINSLSIAHNFIDAILGDLEVLDNLLELKDPVKE